MNIIFITFFAVIVTTIIFVVRSYAWLAEQRIHEPVAPKLTIEHHHHKVETLQNRFMYTTMHDFERMPFSMSMHGQRDPNHHLVRGDDHLAHIKYDYTHKLARHMLETGLVEIQEREDAFPSNPFCKHVQMTVKVVRPEPDHITYAPYGRF